MEVFTTHWSFEALPAEGTTQRHLDSPNTLVVIFAGADTRRATPAIEALASEFPNSVLVGASTAGEVFGDEVSDDSAVVAVCRFDKTRLQAIALPTTGPEDSRPVGVRLAEALAAPDLAAVLLLTDGLLVNGNALLAGLKSVLDPSVIVTGGLAGDGDRFAATWVVANGLPQVGFVTAVGLYGSDVRVGHGSQGGWDTFGVERTVTRAVGSTLFELDGEPALKLYKTYLGDLSEDLPMSGLRFPLAIHERGSKDQPLVRTILAVDENEQSMTFAGDIPEGWVAQLMRANFDRLVEGSSQAAQATTLSTQVSGQCLGLAVSCVGRRLVLRDRIEEEVDAALEALPPGTQLIGFYSYGEISPHTTGTCEFHNQTMTLTTLSEA
jgi:hypothetical protein